MCDMHAPSTVIEDTRPPVVREYLSPAELAFKLGISRGLVYKMLRLGELPYHTAHSRVLIPIAAINAWLQTGSGVKTP